MTHFTTETKHIIPNFPTSVVFLLIHDKLLIALGDESSKFLTCQLSMVVYWPTMPIEPNVPGDENHEFTSTVTDISLKRCVVVIHMSLFVLLSSCRGRLVGVVLSSCCRCVVV